MAEVKRYYYEDGNTLRTIEAPLPSLEERRREAKRKKEIQKRKTERLRSQRMRKNKLTLISVLAVFVVLGGIFFTYVHLRTSIQDYNREIANVEGEISELKAKNMSKTNRINAQANLDAVKDAALNRLGMNYATPDKIVYYEIEDDDFMSQYKAIP
jgi:cell division protein FtsL